MTDDNLVITLAALGLAVGFLAAGLVVGFLMTGGRRGNSVSGYAIDRDSRGRIMSIMPVPFN